MIFVHLLFASIVQTGPLSTEPGNQQKLHSKRVYFRTLESHALPLTFHSWNLRRLHPIRVKNGELHSKRVKNV